MSPVAPFRGSIDDMPYDYSRIWPYVVAVLAVLLIYRRFRRSFGRQPVQPARMVIRVCLLLAIACALVPSAMKSSQFLWAEFAGIISGAALGAWGAHRTRYLFFGGRIQYVPHTHTGIAISLLFVGRLVYRVVDLYSTQDVDTAGIGPAGIANFPTSTIVQTPFTAGLLCVVIGYYVCYYGRVLWKVKHINPEELEVISTSTAASR